MKRFTLMLTCLVVLGLSRVMAQEAPVLTIGEVTSYNSTAIVPVTVADFNEIRACDLKFVFNPSVAMLTNITVG